MTRVLTFTIVMILFAAVGAQAQAVAPGTAPAAQSPQALSRVRGFSVVLVEGSLQEGASSDLPVAARSAIADLKDFLPFKSYRFLDTAWMLGSNHVTGRLRAGDRDYTVQIAAFQAPAEEQLQISMFRLTEVNLLGTLGSSPSFAPPPGSAPVPPQSALVSREQIQMLQKGLAALYAEQTALRAKYGDNHPLLQENLAKIERERARLALADTRSSAESTTDFLRSQQAESPRRAGAGTPLIDTTFSMRAGETVVVGTSRVNGDRALIALMTAVPR
jgi:hypothetical protein